MSLNILFLTYHEVTHQKGGIERMTDVVVNDLLNREGFCCYSAYYYPNKLEHTIFSDKLCLERGNEYRQLARFIEDNGINVLVNQQIYTLDNVLAKLNKCYSLRYIYFQHDRTAVDLLPAVSYYWYAATHGVDKQKKFIFLMKFLISPLYVLMRRFYYWHSFRSIYRNADSVILLSRYFIPVFLRSIGFPTDRKRCIRIINNSVTLPTVSTPENIENKHYEVLIVSRLTEDRKRISLAIKIWWLYQQRYDEAKKWILRIVGDGEYAPDYRRLVKEKNVPNVIFEGQVDDTVQFYHKASAFIMTSDAEGWGLTLMEAQQMGVVPIAFDSYESIHEIIQDGVNGLLVKEGDCNGFVRKLHDLLSDDGERKRMAVSGLDVVNRFSIDRMMEQWMKILGGN